MKKKRIYQSMKIIFFLFYRVHMAGSAKLLKFADTEIQVLTLPLWTRMENCIKEDGGCTGYLVMFHFETGDKGGYENSNILRHEILK